MDHISASVQKPMQQHLPGPDPHLGGLLSEITRVPISRIMVVGSLRRVGEDPRHINALAEVCSELPPIVIHRKTMTVIDGVHRLRAVENSGATHISAVLFNGDEREAFVLAVKLNSNHGLPLSLADRKAAALHMLADFPEWSNRRLAGVVGLSDKTVAALRRRSGAELPHPTAVRLGRDGVAYPLAAAEGRSRALVYLAAHPDASAQEVARAAGISLTTAKDLRKRARAALGEPQTTVRPNAGPVRGSGAGHPAMVNPPRAHPDGADLASAVRRLRADPSLRFTEVGRKLLRTLDPTTAQPHDWAAMASSIPIHCAPLIAELARHHAESWQLLADSLTERINSRETGV
ncbi:ParB/RepB/Spo0J family partition protein [Streptomyces luteogriseus]|uniref:ParB-like chromosome segregation protein Spo0J n=1 Tax=Streptomyces luteogriseus TaxID=68233 RepID=A0A7W7DXV8_9ACTN|nr:ParB/RepB/Spo0J family partition protein [Streptomyces luteogriseus]MBB4717642.1 ParB-like chromosome segregation protein Spo0J [Streptomyces luteogriseus]